KKNELPHCKQRRILKCIERPNGQKIIPSSALYQPFTSLLPAFGWLAGWLVGWLAGGLKFPETILHRKSFKVAK
ncbi:MAG TPA: hypothetical protein PK874_07465, partial [Desulfobacteraceae bacterium]|nr:hypothetical protein [Desulfobacteraceae bacterium]